MSATLLYKCVNGLCKSIGTERSACGITAKVLQVHLIVGDDWRFYLRHGERQVLGIFLVRIAFLLVLAARWLSIGTHCNGNGYQQRVNKSFFHNHYCFSV